MNLHSQFKLPPTLNVLRNVGIISLVLMASACATKGTPPIAEIATARASIAYAESSGAKAVAEGDVTRAQQKLSQAESANKAKRYDESRKLAEQSAADADVAIRKARLDRSVKSLDEVKRAEQTLQEALDSANAPRPKP